MLCAGAFAQDNVLAGFKMAKAPVIDGTIDPAEWEGVPSAQGMFDDETGTRVTENTQFWLAYDENFVYFAAKVFDSQPSNIQANEYRTNVSLSGDDHVVLQIDLGGSLTDFNEFGMNSRGATSIELAGGRAAKREWSGEFVSKGRITAEGWEVEARIPWRIMRLPGAGPRVVRFNVERAHKRAQRDYVWQYTGSGRQDQTGKWTAVELPKAPFERTIKLLPYLYAGADEEGHIANAGLDLKTNLADQIVMVGSVNPDFRNIENAILSLDFSRFERLADETRPFFQEGSQYLDSAIYASQRISNFDAGVNVHGRLGDKISFGVLNTADFGNQNSFVLNTSWDPNPNDSYRITYTDLSTPGFKNSANLFRYSRQFGPYNLFLRNMASSDSVMGDGNFTSTALHYSKGGLFGFLGWDAVSPEFLPRLGFVPERDYKGYTTGFEWGKPIERGFVKQVEVEAFWFDLDRYHGGHYRETFDASASMLFRNDLGLGAGIHLEDFMGTYDRLYSVAATMPRGNPYRFVSAEYEWGTLELATFTSISLRTAYRPIEKIQLTASYQHVNHFEEEDLGIFGFNYDLGRDRYVGGRVVKRDDDWNAYVSFRRSGNQGVEYYVILGDPNAREFKRSLIVKVVWPFEIK